MTKFDTLCAVAGCGLLAGCVIAADVTPHYQVDPLKKSPLETVRPITVLVHIEDERPAAEQDRLGNRKNGLGADAGPVKPTNDVRAVIYEAIVSELQHNGHRVVTNSGSSADRALRIALKKYWTDNKMNFFDITLRATMVTEITIRDPALNKELASRRITGDAEQSRQFAFEGAFEDVLNVALAEFVRNFSRDRTLLRALQTGEPSSTTGTISTVP